MNRFAFIGDMGTGDNNQYRVAKSLKKCIDINDLQNFYDLCINELDLNIIGLMCLPPANFDPSIYFNKMEKALKKLPLNELSMGMSSDYLTALIYNASFLRIGSKIFGKRN